MLDLSSVISRFQQRFTVTPECWIWNGAPRNQSGYGGFLIDGKQWLAHRVAWRLYKGEIPAGKQVLHRCDNRRCVRPDHLFIGTNADNVRDRDAKDRGAKLAGEKNGEAKLTAQQVGEIRRRLAKGASQSALGREYGVHNSTIHLIHRRKKWKHLP
ncbi:MAG TPA: HNH endonuclease [Gemmatimonadaceae bacterium]